MSYWNNAQPYVYILLDELNVKAHNTRSADNTILIYNTK